MHSAHQASCAADAVSSTVNTAVFNEMFDFEVVLDEETSVSLGYLVSFRVELASAKTFEFLRWCSIRFLMLF
jgi:hypothetical protein